MSVLLSKACSGGYDVRDSLSSRVEELDTIKLGLLGNSICLGPDGTGAVSAMAVIIHPDIVNIRSNKLGTTLEFLDFISCHLKRRPDCHTGCVISMPVSRT
jgi:hypothetical protein